MNRTTGIAREATPVAPPQSRPPRETSHHGGAVRELKLRSAPAVVIQLIDQR